MSASVSGNTSSVPDARVRLIALVRNFDRDPNGGRKQIKELAESNPESFYGAVIEILRQDEDSRGSQFLVAMLVTYNLLLRALCDPCLSRKQAIELARAAARVDPMVDVSLAKRLAEGAASADCGLRPDDAGRVMEILSEISDGSRILPSLMRLLRSPHPYIRSKAVKLVGRGGGSVKWVRGRLTEADPRVRANAIEALWGVDNEEARELLQVAARDGNNRVAGNALLALYRLGDCSVIPDLLRMSEHDSALFRSTAAWVMGETGDPRFAEALARLLREANPSVRARAMFSLGRIKAATALSRQGPEWLATGMLQESDPKRQTRRLQVAVTTRDGGDHQKVLPTQFLLTEDGRQVMNYRVTERPFPEAMSVIFLFPRSGIPGRSAWTLGALNCRSWKRNSDLWAIQTYASGDHEDVGEHAHLMEEAPRYSANLETITMMLTNPAPRGECVELWRSFWNVIRSDSSQSRGRRHLIVFVDEPPQRAPGDGLVSALNASRMPVQVISTISDAAVERFCRRTGASLKAAVAEESVIREIELAYLNLLARYEIAYSSAGNAEMLKIRVNSPDGWAEMGLAIPGG